jgi:hypothetical protein
MAKIPRTIGQAIIQSGDAIWNLGNVIEAFSTFSPDIVTREKFFLSNYDTLHSTMFDQDRIMEL